MPGPPAPPLLQALGDSRINFQWHGHGLRSREISLSSGSWCIFSEKRVGWFAVDITTLRQNIGSIRDRKAAECTSHNSPGQHEIANQLVVNVQVGQGMPKPAVVEDVINGHTPFNFNKWLSRQPTPKEVKVKQTEEGTLVIGSIEKTFKKPLTEASTIASG